MIEKLSKEKRGKYKYTYIDYKTKEIVFECVTDNILEADKQYEDAIGKNPAKQSGVGCAIELATEK
ncbi:MAG: hypothetical protein HYT12_02710 [Candidatus Liptonbacteria bacterium]|nr:hypothetical protein [Candidatus Liptonbacteria bacterium]